MQQSQRYTPSVSDLYGTDEIEFLLEEIRDLETACCQLEEVQDFEIAGSRAGELSLSLESPLETVTSWDSHVHYRHRMGQGGVPWGVALHCDTSHLKSTTGIFRILLVISSAACLACECSAGTVQVGLFILPLIGRLRLMMFCTLFSLLITCLMLFLDVSHIALMFPFNWSRVNVWMFMSIGFLYVLSSTLMVHMVLYADVFMWVPRYTKDTLFISAIIGYACAMEAFILSSISFCSNRRYRQVPVDDEIDFCIQERELSPLSSTDVQRNHFTKNYNDINNHYGNHNNSVTSPTTMNSNYHNSYTPIKRPDQADNRRPTLGNMYKPQTRYRQGYHYQPVASTSQQSPTFVLTDHPHGISSSPLSNDISGP